MHTEKQVGGFIITYSVIDDPIIEYLRKHSIPFVLIGQPYDALSNTIYVDNDNQLLGQQATDYLIKMAIKTYSLSQIRQQRTFSMNDTSAIRNR